MHEMVDKILGPLSVNVMVEKNVHRLWVASQYNSGDNVQLSHLGMGSQSETWYGCVDARLRGYSADDDNVDDVILLCDHDDDDGSETDGGTTILELKRKSKGLSQAIGSAILASFIERKRHPTLQPLYPCIFMNCSTVTFLFYDCENDFLVITDPINLYYHHRRIARSSILVLWLVLNHR